MNWEAAGYVLLAAMVVCSSFCLIRGAAIAKIRKRAEGKG